MLSGCHSSPVKEDPSKTFQNIRSAFMHGDLSVAQKEAEEAQKNYSGLDADWSMKFRLLNAEILTYQGRRPDVLALLDSKDVSYPAGGDIAIKRDLLCGLAHARLGQEQLSDLEIQEARRIADSSKSPLMAEVLRTEAQVQVYRNHLNEAAALFKESLQAARAGDDEFLEATDLLNLGFVELKREHYDEAVASFNGATDLAKPIQARYALQVALGNLGVAYFHLGDFEKALYNFKQAEKEARETGGTYYQVLWLWNAGSSDYELGRLDDAKLYYEQSLKSATAINAREEIAGTNTELALLLFKEGQFDSAKTYCDEAIRTASELADESAKLEPLFVEALLATQTPNGRNPEQMLLRVHEKSAGTPYLLWDIEDALANYYNGRHQAAEAERWYRRAIQTFETKRDSVKTEELKLPFFGNGEALYRDYADFLISSRRQKDALKLLDLGRARTLEEGLGAAKQNFMTLREDVDPQTIARKHNSAILFYSLGAEKSYLWAVTATRTSLFVLPKKQEIESHVQSYQRAILKSNDALREANVDGRYLYDTIVAPAAAMIGAGSKVFIVPDGGLNALNFETLLKPGGERFHYWIEDVTLTNANSIRLLSRFDSSSSKEANDLLLIGNPVSSDSEYERLPNAPAEVDEIKRHFPANRETVLTQAEAVPSAYGTVRPERFEYIHFVAHGTASRLSPLDSAVVLSASATHADDYKLYAREIVRHPLHARLVTISSCYGSGLRAYAGEELVGLSWAFLRAGAHNVIGALWAVNDASTPQLMDRLYGGLEGGSKPDEALRAAKLEMMRSSGVMRKPMYWAAFQLYAGS
jgi:CHAT domain-containing protein/predicted negative regulator of RcsB-dependent stress response